MEIAPNTISDLKHVPEKFELHKEHGDVLCAAKTCRVSKLDLINPEIIQRV